MAGLLLGLAVERDRVAIDARYGGALVFTLRGTSDSATFVDTENRRVTTGPAAAILEALVGVPLEPARLLAVLTGCVATEAAPSAMARIGSVLRATFADAEVYLVRADAGWQIRAGTFDRWNVDYPRRDASGPGQIVLRSVGTTGAAIDLRLIVAASNTTRRDPSVFSPVVPAGAEVVTIESLRENGPFGTPR